MSVELSEAQISAAAQAAIPFLPSSTPLEVLAVGPGAPRPDQDATVIAASLVGTNSMDLAIVASELISEALAGAEGLTLADALRPALEAASSVLATGVLDATVSSTVGEYLADESWSFAAIGSGGQAEGWFAVRSHSNGAGEAFASDMPTNVQENAGGESEYPAKVAGGSIPQNQATPAQRADSMRLLYDVEMTLSAEIGRTKLPVHDVLDLSPGAVIELDRSAGSPADVMVNGRLIARGEIVVVDEEYGIRITEIVSLADQNA